MCHGYSNGSALNNEKRVTFNCEFIFMYFKIL